MKLKVGDTRFSFSRRGMQKRLFRHEILFASGATIGFNFDNCPSKARHETEGL
jgi:hypothetical protein